MIKTIKKAKNARIEGFVFISSPYLAVLQNITDKQYAMSLIRQYARFGCKKAMQNKAVPFSPILTFEGLFDEESQRDLIMDSCFEALSKCEALYVIKTGYFSLSKGMQDEIAYARSIRLPIIEFDYEGVSK